KDLISLVKVDGVLCSRCYFMHLFSKLKYPFHFLISLKEFNSQKSRCFSSFFISASSSTLKNANSAMICRFLASSGSAPFLNSPPILPTSKYNSTACNGGFRNSWTQSKSFTAISKPVSSKNSLFKLSTVLLLYSIPPPGTFQKQRLLDIWCLIISIFPSSTRTPLTLKRNLPPNFSSISFLILSI